MRISSRAYSAVGVLVAIVVLGASAELFGQSVTSNPFRPIYGWGELPEGRAWGSTSSVEIALDGTSVFLAGVNVKLL